MREVVNGAFTRKISGRIKNGLSIDLPQMVNVWIGGQGPVVTVAESSCQFGGHVGSGNRFVVEIVDFCPSMATPVILQILPRQLGF